MGLSEVSINIGKFYKGLKIAEKGGEIEKLTYLQSRRQVNSDSGRMSLLKRHCKKKVRGNWSQKDPGNHSSVAPRASQGW